MRIFFPDLDISIGSQRIPFIVYRDALVKYFNIIPVYGDALPSADIVFTLSGTGLAQHVTSVHPDIPVITVKPHLEEVFKSSSANTLHNLSSFVYYKLVSNQSFKDCVIADNLCSSLLISDTPRLQRFFASCGFNTVYLPLIDCFMPDIQPFNHIGVNNAFHILFHGNLAHFNSNINQLLAALNSSFPGNGNFRSVHLHCVSRFKTYSTQFPKTVFPVTIHRYPYDLKLLHSLLLSSHIGWAPNLYNLYNTLCSSAFKAFLTSSTQIDDILTLTKFSANFGRSLLFAQYNLPFIAHCCEESIFFYNSFSNHIFYDDPGSLVYLLRKYLDDDFRLQVSSLISRKFSYSNLLRKYTCVLYDSMLALLGAS